MKKGLLLILLIFALMPAQAQDEAEPLLEMLVHLPEVTDGSPIVLYADVDLYMSGWLDVPVVNSIEDYEALSQDERSVYFRSLPMVMVGAIRDDLNSETHAEFLEGYGIDLFSIEQTLNLRDEGYQEPFMVLRGDFEEDTFINLQLEAGYSQREEASWTVLCPESDCEGDFGDDGLLSGGFILRENLLINSMSPAYLAASEAIINGSAASRLDVPDYAASAKLLLAEGDVSQVLFVEPAFIAEINEFYDADSADVETLPPYGLVTIAELVFTEDEVTEVHIILSYENAEDAETAAENLEENLENPDTFNALFWEELDAELEGVGIREDGATGLFLVQAIISSPFQRDGYDMSSSSLFRLIYANTFTFFDASWLLVED